MSPEESGKQTLLMLAEPFGQQQRFHCLTVVRGTQPGRAVLVGEQALVLGRDVALPFHLADPEVSWRHCEVRLTDGGLVVCDLGSTNGTYVEGARVEQGNPAGMPVSSHLQVGKHELRHDLLTREEFERQQELALDLDRARRHVEALFPPEIESGPLRVEWCFVPSAVLGGDALGYQDLGNGRLAVYVVDACGHGVGAAMHAASVLNVLRTKALAGADFGQPEQVLGRLNEAFQMEMHNGMYFSLWYGVVDPSAGTIRYSAAGHPPALLLGPDDSAPRRVSTKNPPIGTGASCSFSQAEERFTPGDRLYVFSDGAYELLDRDGVERGFEDFERDLANLAGDRSPGGPRRLYDAALCTAGADLLRDDFTMLVIRSVPG